MKRISYLLLGLVGLLLTACVPESPYTTEKVHVDLEVKQLSAGYCEVRCKPVGEKGHKVKDAYYFVDMIPVQKGVDLYPVQKNFMELVLDSVYMKYIIWRHDVLMSGTPYVADFASHSLYYDEMSATFTFLTPDTDYWLIGFIVDPEKNQPVGDLTVINLHTKATSNMKVNFSMRVNGYWTYFYPYDEKGSVLSNFPYLAATVDSADLASRLDTSVWKPATFFVDSIKKVTKAMDYDNTPVLYGIVPTYNDGREGRANFLPGHTYYTAMAGFDGGLGYNQRAIYKYHFDGPESKFVLDFDQDAISGMCW